MKFVSLSFFLLPFVAVSSFSKAFATSLDVSGHVAAVGQCSTSAPPADANQNAFRVPVGLILHASPTDHINMYLGLDYAYNNYPEAPVLLGQTSSDNTSNPSGTSTPMPFSNAVNGSTPYGQKVDQISLTQAYFTYQTPAGILMAGRMPRDWGLGIWLDDQWDPYGGTGSTTDSIGFYSKFNLFDMAFYIDKYGESVGGTSNDGDANAITFQVRLKNDPVDMPSSGISREIGVSYSKFSNKESNTSIDILDFYTKLYTDQLYFGGELLYPSGHTQSPNYQALGGASACDVSMTGVVSGSQTCMSQNFSALGALLKLKMQLAGPENSTLLSTERAQLLSPTSSRMTTHTASVWLGYASGGSNQFQDSAAANPSNNISAILLNSSLQPSFLMFNNTLPAVNGMPMGQLTNTTFARVDYTYETPSFGSITPLLVWGVLNQTNDNYNSSYSLCNGSTSTSVTSSTNSLCVGGSKNLGVELNVDYKYTTKDRLTFDVDGGYWFVGDAWQVYGQETPKPTFGMRVAASTQF